MSNSPYIVFGKPDIGAAEKAEILDSLDVGWLGTGPKVKRFELEFARYKGIDVRQVVAVNSCTAALHLSLLAAGIKPGDEVITTSMTFCATVNAIIHAGGTPVLADVLPDTFNIDPDDIERRITPRTRAIVPVHFSGMTCDMGRIMALAAAHGLKVVEDCAHAIESTFAGRPLGTIGDFGCFSFYVTKNMTTGEGGMVCARSEEDANRIKRLALHGMSADAWSRFSDDGYKHYQVVEPGFKYNMMDLQAALGIHQLARLDERWQRRKELYARYVDELQGLPVTLPEPGSSRDRNALHLFAILLDDDAPLSRDEFMSGMHKAGIGTGVHYRSIPTHEYYRRTYGWRAEDWPRALQVGNRTVSLPFSAALSGDEIGRIVDKTRSLLAVR